MEKRKIAICVPTAHSIPGVFFANFMDFWTYNSRFFNMQVHVVDWYLIDQARNDAIRKVLKSGFRPDYFLFLDADHLPDRTMLQHLVHADKDIVSALYFSRVPPYYPVVRNINEAGLFYIPTELEPNALIPVDSAGAGSLLVKSKVILKMGDPWFKVVEDEDKGLIGEDLFFFLKAKEHGFQPYVDTSCVCKHWGAVLDEKPWKYYHSKGQYTVNKVHEPKINWDPKTVDYELSKTLWKALEKNPKLQLEAYKEFKRKTEKLAKEKSLDEEVVINNG